MISVCRSFLVQVKHFHILKTDFRAPIYAKKIVLQGLRHIFTLFNVVEDLNMTVLTFHV